jgi:hypothetical protein
MRYPARFVSDDPSALRTGGVHDSVAAPVEAGSGELAALTVIENAGKDVVLTPSFALMRMFEYVPM